MCVGVCGGWRRREGGEEEEEGVCWEGEARGVCVGAWEGGKRGPWMYVCVGVCVCGEEGGGGRVVWVGVRGRRRKEREEEGGQRPTRAQLLTSVASVAPPDVCLLNHCALQRLSKAFVRICTLPDDFHEADDALLPTTFLAATLS